MPRAALDLRDFPDPSAAHETGAFQQPPKQRFKMLRLQSKPADLSLARASQRARAMLLLAILLSLLVGLSLGLLGGGGSILTVPILRYALGLEAHRAIALSLLVVGATSLAALIPHARRGCVRWRTGIVFGLAGMLGAFLAGRVAKFVPPSVLLVAFGLMMFATAIAMLRSHSPQSSPAGAPANMRVLKVLAEGFAVGAVTGLVGAGGGFLVVPALVLLGGLPIGAAIGTSLLVIAMKSFAGFAGFLGHTPIDWTLGLTVSAAAIVGSVAGSALVSRVSPAQLRTGFGWFVVAMAFFILAQEVPAVVGRAPSIAIAVLAALLGTGALAALKRVARRFKRKAQMPEILLGTERVTPKAGGTPS
jgi:uncharacterized protein